MSASNAWPPKQLDQIRNRIDEWSAWWAGDRGMLESAGQAATSVHRTGLSGLLTAGWRKFWGAPAKDSSTEPKIKVHVPLAADIVRASSDLLFAEPPSITAEAPGALAEDADPADTVAHALWTAEADATTAHIGRYVDDGLISVFAGAAESCAALGGVFIRAAWDHETSRVFATRVDADAAIPEFRWGRLRRVTFWRTLAPIPGNGAVYRHLEVHEQIDLNAGDPESGRVAPERRMVGVIRHQLWQGKDADLGYAVPLTEHPATADIADLIDTDGDAISTMSPGLDVVYVPNVTPNALWRSDPVGANLGAADIAGSEDLLDRLDHVYSSLLREVDLAKARIVVPEYMIEDLGAGKGVGFDADREVWSPLPGATAPMSGQQPMNPQLFQPAIRVDDHIKIMQQLVEDILRSSGYSAATFGEDEGGAVTATEVNSKTNRSRSTRARKIRHWVPAVLELVRKMLAVDVELGRLARAFDSASELFAPEGVNPDLVTVVFPAPQQSPMELAQTVALLDQARAISTAMKVAMAHPDWDEAEVDAEVKAILAEQGEVLADPTEVGIENTTPALDPAQVKAAADAMGVLIRAGVDSDDAARRVGLDGLEFTGAMPTSLRLPERDAAGLEQL